MDLNEKEFTYSNLVILQIRRMLGNMLYTQEMKDSEIVNIALDVLRILMEISTGVCHITEDNEREWDLFFQAEKSEKDLTFFIHELYMQSKVKNTLLNDVLEGNETEDLKKLIKHYKEKRL